MFDSKRRSGGCGCGSGSDLVAYLYGEIGNDERERFELHLEGCADCAEELASFASLRISIGEWRKAEPVADVAKEASPERYGLIAAFQGWIIANFGIRAVAGAAAIALLAALGLFALINYSGETGTPTVVREELEETENVLPREEFADGTSEPQSDAPLPDAEAESPVPASETTKLASAGREPAAAPVRRKSVSRPTREVAEASEPPRLSEAASEDIEDDSLRLTDLFTDVSED